MTLLQPWFLLLALAVPAALLWRARRGAPAVRFAPGAFLAGGLPRTWRTVLWPLPPVLQVLGVLCAVVALARPAASTLSPLVTEGIDILLCLDTSSSMTANDMDRRRTRLQVARDAAARFVEGRLHDRIGLVAFARYADLLCPPTPDHDALARILADVATVAGDGPEDATGIGTAVARAAQVLAGGGARSPVVILLTDGEENVATVGAPDEIAPTHAAQLCEALGVRVHAVAVGSAPSDALKALASRTGGRCYEARDAAAVTAVYERIDTLEKTAFEEPRREVEDRYLPFLAAAVALVVVGRLLGATVLGVAP